MALGDFMKLSWPRCVFGKAITSRRLSPPASINARRSKPNAKPPCGGAPVSSASSMKPADQDYVVIQGSKGQITVGWKEAWLRVDGQAPEKIGGGYDKNESPSAVDPTQLSELGLRLRD